VLDTDFCECPLPEVIRWKRQWVGSERVVWINVDKLNSAWRRDTGFYFRLGSCKRHPFGVWLRRFGNTERAWMPLVGYYFGYISFTDGRHRFAWCRDNGVKVMPVTVESKKQVEIIQKVFGSTARTCRIPPRARMK
jgi:hypothetical protein